MMYSFYITFQMRNFDTDIGTEELTHHEMVATIIHQLTKTCEFQSKGDIITDLMEDMAAEQKAAPPTTTSCA